jgi:hypothetical protein
MKERQSILFILFILSRIPPFLSSFCMVTAEADNDPRHSQIVSTSNGAGASSPAAGRRNRASQMQIKTQARETTPATG